MTGADHTDDRPLPEEMTTVRNLWTCLNFFLLVATLSVAGCKSSTPPTSATAGAASEPNRPSAEVPPPQTTPVAATEPTPDTVASPAPSVPPRDGLATVTAMVEALKGEHFGSMAPLYPSVEALDGCVVKSSGQKLADRLPELLRQAKENFERRQAQPGSCRELKPQKVYVVRGGESRLPGIGVSSAEEREDIGGDGCRARDVRMDIVADVLYSEGRTGEIRFPRLLQVGDDVFVWTPDEPVCFVGPLVPVAEFERAALALPAAEETPPTDDLPDEETEVDLEHAHLQEIPAETVAAIVAGDDEAAETGQSAEGLKTAVADAILQRVQRAKRHGDEVSYPLMLGDVGTVVMNDATLGEDGTGTVTMRWYVTRTEGGARQPDKYGHTIPFVVKHWQHGVSARWDNDSKRWLF